MFTDILTGQSVGRNFSTEVSLAMDAVSSWQARMTFTTISAKDKKNFCEVNVMISTILQKPAERDFSLKYISLATSSLLFGDSGQWGILSV